MGGLFPGFLERAIISIDISAYCAVWVSYLITLIYSNFFFKRGGGWIVDTTRRPAEEKTQVISLELTR